MGGGGERPSKRRIPKKMGESRKKHKVWKKPDFCYDERRRERKNLKKTINCLQCLGVGTVGFGDASLNLEPKEG